MADRVVMRGALSDIGLVALLRTVSLSRQRMVIELFEADHRVGAIFLKSGHVVGLEPAAPDALRWLRELLASAAHRDFTVSRLDDAATPLEPLAVVGELLAALDAEPG